MDYKYKYLKYILKNKLLYGLGDILITNENIEGFIVELLEINSTIKSKFDNYVITGSSAIVYLLYKLVNKDIEGAKILLYSSDMLLPHDFDFLYSDTQYNSAKIDSYTRKQDTINNSLTFIHETNKSFDITKSKFNKFIIHDIPIIDLHELLSYYNDDAIDSDAHRLKIDALKFIIHNKDKLDIDKEIIKKDIDIVIKRLPEKDFTFESPKRKNMFDNPSSKRLTFGDF
jgi:hypothetical protein